MTVDQWKWTDDELTVLETYGHMETFDELMERLPGRTKNAIKSKRYEMGIRYLTHLPKGMNKVLIPLIRKLAPSAIAHDIIHNTSTAHMDMVQSVGRIMREQRNTIAKVMSVPRKYLGGN